MAGRRLNVRDADGVTHGIRSFTDGGPRRWTRCGWSTVTSERQRSSAALVVVDVDVSVDCILCLAEPEADVIFPWDGGEPVIA